MTVVRYSRWDGSQEEFSLDSEAALDALSDLMMEGLTAGEAMEWMREHGFELAGLNMRVMGVQDLIRELRDQARELYERYAHRFTVVVPLPDPCDVEVMQAVIERIVNTNKPAHTEHRVEIVHADARVGIQNRVGIDLVIGAQSANDQKLADEQANGSTGSVLGKNSILGDRGTGFLGGNFNILGGDLDH